MCAAAQKIKGKINVNLKESGLPVNLPDCYTRIAEIAYYKAESRGFVEGHELEDWFEAESEILSSEERLKKNR